MLVSIVSHGQNSKFEQAMRNALDGYANCKTVQDFNQLSNKFKVIANAEEDQWLPLYYHAHTQIIMSFMESDAIKKDEYLDVAETAIKTMTDLSPNEAEIYALEAMMYTARLVVNPMVRGQEYSIKSNTSAQKALGLDKSNPRAQYILLSNEIGKTQFFGGDISPYCERGHALVANWDDNELRSDLHPKWGKEQMSKMLSACAGEQATQSKSAGHTLMVELPKLKDDDGTIVIMLYDENEQTVAKQNAPIVDQVCTIRFEHLEVGNYGVRYYHDRNGNGKLDTGAFGKPTEGFGYSNDARGFSSAPKTEDSIFTLEDDMTITLKTSY